MLANSDCTVYLFDKQTEGFVRKYAEKVYWCENKSGSIVKSGMQAFISPLCKVALFH